MTDPADLLNTGEPVEANGHVWTLSHVTPAIRAKYGAAVKARARKELLDARRAGELEGDLYRELLASLQEEIAAGAYSWGSPLDPDGMGSAIRAALSQTEGRFRLVQLLLEPHHGTVPDGKVLEMIAAAPEQVGDALARCMGVEPPNRQTPAAKTSQSQPGAEQG